MTAVSDEVLIHVLKRAALPIELHLPDGRTVLIDTEEWRQRALARLEKLEQGDSAA